MKSKREFRSRVERKFQEVNPTATITGWTRGPLKVTFPTGVKGYVGSFHAVAEGYRPAVMHASWTDAGLMIR
jgi:hypothetical protein